MRSAVIGGSQTPDDEISYAQIVIGDNRNTYFRSVVSDPKFILNESQSILLDNRLINAQDLGIQI